MTELTTIDPNNYGAMAKAMGIANEAPAKSKSSSLARLRINHSPIMGTAEVKGKSVNVETVSGGTYKLEIPDGDTYFANSVKIRPHMQRFMYKRFVMGGANAPNRYVKTIMSDNLNVDLKDNDGGFNCGKPAGYIKDWKALPEKMQELIRSIKRVRVVIGMVTLHNAKDEQGKKVSISDSPFIWEIDNREAFKAVGDAFNTLGKHKRLPLQHNMAINTEERQIPSGAKYYVPNVSINLTETISISEDDQKLFGDFMEWVDNYNAYVSSKWSENVNNKMAEDDVDVIDILVDEAEIEVG